PNNETIQPIISPSYAQAFSKSNFAASMRAFYARRTLGRIARRLTARHERASCYVAQTVREEGQVRVPRSQHFSGSVLYREDGYATRQRSVIQKFPIRDSLSTREKSALHRHVYVVA
ncbi:MAG: hypothetical protein AB7M12_08945, partial [Hyphomonadaceae bacterium]